MRREFELTNGDGDAISLNDKKGLLGVDPEGLGISISNNFNASNGNQRLVECEADFEEFKIDIIYGLRDHQQTYQIYLEFVKFLSHPPIVLKYASDAGEKYRNVALKRLTKSERSFGRLLKESLLLEYLTPWYEVKKAEIQQSNQKIYTRGKIYGFTFPYVYTQNANEKTGTFNVSNDSVYLFNNKDRSSPVKVTVSGECKNPYWEVFKDGELVASDGFFLNLEEGQTLVVSSLFQDRTALLYDSQGNISSVYQQQDHTKTNFVHMPIGNSSIVFHTANAEVSVEVYEECDVF